MKSAAQRNSWDKRHLLLALFSSGESFSGHEAPFVLAVGDDQDAFIAPVIGAAEVGQIDIDSLKFRYASPVTLSGYVWSPKRPRPVTSDGGAPVGSDVYVDEIGTGTSMGAHTVWPVVPFPGSKGQVPLE